MPGSHKLTGQMRLEANQVGALPRAINLEAPAGTVMLFDGRLLHGTGVNHTDEPRFVCIMSNIKPWMRSQDNFALAASPEVLREASDKLLHRMGFQAINFGVVEGQGILGSGRPGDPRGSTVAFRRAMDEGHYLRVGELDPGDADGLAEPFTFRETSEGERAARRLQRAEGSKL